MVTISQSWLEERAEEFKASIAFSTRLPLVSATPVAAGAVAKAAWAFPIAGVVVGLIGAIVYVLAHRLGLPPWLRSPIMGQHLRSHCNDQRRAAPHCMMVNLVRSGRKQP